MDLGSMGSSLLLGTEDEDLAAANHCMGLKGEEAQLYAPEDGFTIPVPRFKDNIAALRQFTDFGLPPLCVVRPRQVVQVFYGFGDALGKQFGATLSQNYDCKAQCLKTVKDKRGIRFRIGLWSAAEEAESLNYKELKNLVDTVSKEAKAGRLQDCELFMFTDNSTAKSCFYPGSSKLRQLHALVMVLRTLEMTYGMTIHVIHVSGKRMIAQGTDGCSRGLHQACWPPQADMQG